MEIEILGAETSTQKAAQIAKLYEIWGAETRLDSAKSAERRGNFVGVDKANNRTGWLGERDPNLKMPVFGSHALLA